MGLQLSGTTYIDSNGHFVNGLKSANGTPMSGTGAITTGQGAANTFGTSFNVVGTLTIGYTTGNFNASGNYFLSSGYQRQGVEQGGTIAGSNIYEPTFPNPSYNEQYWFLTDYATNGPLSGHSGGSAGTWMCLTPAFEDPTWTADVVDLFIRIS